MARQLRSMGYQAVALKGGYQAWRERYPVEPKSLPVDLKTEREESKWADLHHVTPAMDHFLAAKHHTMGHRPSPNFVENKPPADGRQEPVQEALSAETETPTDAAAPNGHENGRTLSNGGAIIYDNDSDSDMGVGVGANATTEDTSGDKNDL